MMAGVLLRRHGAGAKRDENDRRRDAADERSADHMSLFPPLPLVFGVFRRPYRLPCLRWIRHRDGLNARHPKTDAATRSATQQQRRQFF
jgi:hypothetical protein